MLSGSLLSGKGDVVLPARGLGSNTRPNSSYIFYYTGIQFKRLINIKALSKIVSIVRYRSISNTGWLIKIISPLSLVWNKQFCYIPQLKCTQLDLHAIIYNQDVCGLNPGSVCARRINLYTKI